MHSESGQSWRSIFGTSGELFSQKVPPQMPNQQSHCAFSHNLKSFLTIATLTIHQLCKYI